MNKGFTLIEVLVGIVILAIISVACFTTVSLLTRSTEFSHKNIIAANFMQKSMEEVRRVAQTNFDDLNSCAFPAGGTPTSDACGFQVTQTQFPGYTRTLAVTDEYATSKELKRVRIAINWNEMGMPRELKAAILLSRPPEPLPGNIFGRIYRAGDFNDIIEGAEVKINLSGETDEETAVSVAGLDAQGANYDFSAPVSGQYLLKPGNWDLQVEHDGFEDYIHPVPVYVPPGDPPARADIPLTPLPEPATIHFQLVDRVSNVNLSGYSSSAHVQLWDGNSLYASMNGRVNGTFEVTFPEPTSPAFVSPRCFTLNTDNAYRSLRAYKVNALSAPSCRYPYNADGWSSAYVQADNSLVCTNPYWGIDANDRICVEPADNLNLTIPLDRVPTVRVTGRVTGLAPNQEGRVYVYWPRREGNPYYQWFATGINGTFDIQVPAVQSLFGDANPVQDYLLLRPYGPVLYQGCCESNATTNRYGAYYQVGPLFEGDSPRDAGLLDLPAYPDSQCGNVHGEIHDAKTSASIHGASVTLRGVNQNTTLGQYLYACPGSGFRLPQGANQVFVTNHAQYYAFASNGNLQYASRPGADIVADTLTQYNASLWPRGYGRVDVNVVDASTTGPIANVMVNLKQYDGTILTGTTDAHGLVTFNSVLETWPPADLPAANPNFRYTQRDHTVTAVSSPTENYTLPASEAVTGLNAGDTVAVTINLLPKGAM